MLCPYLYPGANSKQDSCIVSLATYVSVPDGDPSPWEPTQLDHSGSDVLENQCFQSKSSPMGTENWWIVPGSLSLVGQPEVVSHLLSEGGIESLLATAMTFSIMFPL